MNGFIYTILAVMAIALYGCDKNGLDKCCDCMGNGVPSDAYLIDSTLDLRGIPYTGKIKLLQVPPRTLEKMCPLGLVETCLNYRLIYLPFAHNNVKVGLEQMHNDFNGMQELILRSGAQSPFVSIYRSMDPTAYDSDAEPLELGRFSAKFRNIELLMAYDPIRDKFTQHEKVILLENAIRILNLKQENTIYGGPSLIVNIFFIANIMDSVNFEEFETFVHSRPYIREFINGFLNNLQYVSDGDRIVDIAKNYINQNR